MAKAAAAIGEFAGFPKATFEFLAGIAAHNEKAWFDAHVPADKRAAYWRDFHA